jgi:hypothetical protein
MMLMNFKKKFQDLQILKKIGFVHLFVVGKGEKSPYPLIVENNIQIKAEHYKSKIDNDST